MNLWALITISVLGGFLLLLCLIYFILWRKADKYKKEKDKEEKNEEKIMSKKRVLFLATDGVEQVELLAPHDILIRNGYDVDIAYGTEHDHITTSYNIKIKADLKTKDVVRNLDQYMAVFLPGGPGFEKLDKVIELDSILNYFHKNGKIIAAICAAPSLLAKRGYLQGKKSMSHPSVREVMKSNGAIIEVEDCKTGNTCSVVVDGKIITGLDMLSSLYFAQEFVKLLKKYS